jgi:hypothetical protein
MMSKVIHKKSAFDASIHSGERTPSTTIDDTSSVESLTNCDNDSSDDKCVSCRSITSKMSPFVAASLDAEEIKSLAITLSTLATREFNECNDVSATVVLTLRVSNKPFRTSFIDSSTRLAFDAAKLRAVATLPAAEKLLMMMMQWHVRRITKDNTFSINDARLWTSTTGLVKFSFRSPYEGHLKTWSQHRDQLENRQVMLQVWDDMVSVQVRKTYIEKRGFESWCRLHEHTVESLAR